MSLYNDASLAMIPSAVKDGKLYSIRPTDGSGDFTFSRGSNLAATRVDVNGLIEKGRENILLQSNQFDTTWTTPDSSVTGGQSGYDGSSDAWLFETTVSGATIQQSFSSTGVLTFSVYAKAGSVNGIRLRIDAAIDANGYYNLLNGTVFSSVGIDATIADVGNGWYKCSLSHNISSPVKLQFFTTDGTTSYDNGNIYIQDAQLEVGLVATDYIETTTTTAVSGITEDLPRLDYSGGASCPSLLLEPTRTNINANSEIITAVVGTNVSVNNTTSPDGYLNATKLIEDTSTGVHLTGFGGNLGGSVDSSVYSVSIFAKGAGRTRFQMFDNNQSIHGLTNFDLSNGTIISGSGKIEPYLNGWYRCIIFPSKSTSITANLQVRIISSGTTTSYTGNGTDGLFLWGKQIESNASYPSSYIPTYGSAVTRSQDVSYVSSATSLIGQTQGTLFVEGRIDGQESYNRRLLTISDGGTANKIEIFNPSNSLNIKTAGTVSTVTQFEIQSGDILTIGDTFKVAVAYAQNDFVMYINGTQIGTDSSGNIPTTNKINLGRGDNNFNAESPINQALLFKTRLTNGELAALTTL
jgi:hypothetical protein